MKRRDLKIMWSSNSHFSYSGYGTFTRDIIKRMTEDGWPVAEIAWWGVDGHPIETKDMPGVTVYPKMRHVFGSDAMVYHGRDWKANVIFAMQDIWSLDPSDLQQLKYFIPYLPIDKEPAPKSVTNNLNYAYRILTFSKFGHDELEKANFTSRLIVEGTDTNIFKPVDISEARKKYAIPEDVFLFSIIGANKENPPRKGHQESLTAFAKFLQENPDSNARLLFSSQQQDPAGFPIREYADYLKILDKLFFTDEYSTVFKFTSEDINALFNATDILMHPSQTEGFGLTIIEAASAGTPVVIQNCNSMPELIQEGKTGWGANTLYKQFRNDGGFTNIADPNSVFEAMTKAYKAVKTDPKKVSKDCRDWVVANYNIDTIYKEKWSPLLEELQEEILPIDKIAK
jgi:glycosyltransferase involved in cell wall biosynthesis